MKEDIKNIFKNHFDSADTDLDTSVLWEAIEAKRQPRKKKRLFFLLPFGLLLCGIIYVSLFNLSKPGSAITSTKIKTKQHKLSTPISNNNQTKEIANEIAVRQDFPALDAQSLKENKEEEKSEAQVRILDSKAKPRTNTSTQVFPSNQGGIDADNKIINLDKSESLQTLEANDVALELVNVNHPTYQTMAKDETTLSSSKGAETLDFVRNVQPLEFLAIGVSWEGKLIKNTLDLELIPTQKPQANSSSNFDLSLLGSISTFNTSYAEDIAGSSVSEWQSALSPFLSVSTDLIVGWSISDRIRIGSGLSYSRISEKLTWDSQYIADDDGNYVGEVNVANPVLSLAGTTTNERLFQLVDRNILHYNNYHLLDVPVILQVKLIDKRLELSPYASASFNLWSSQSGYLLDENNIPLQLSDSVKQSVGIAYGGGLELGYALGESFSLVSRAQLSIRKLTLHNIDRRITQPELYVGLRHHF